MNPGSGPLQEEAVIARLRSSLAETEELHFDFERATFFSFRTPVEVEVYSDSIEELHDAAAPGRAALADVPGPRRPALLGRDGQPRGPGPLRPRAARPPRSRSRPRSPSTVRTKVQGEVATRFTEGDREIDIRVRALEQGDAKVEDIHDLIVGHVDGRPIFLKSVAAHRSHRRPDRDPPHRPETGRRGRRQPLGPRHGRGGRRRSGQAQRRWPCRWA